LRDFPDATLARRALENAPFKVVVDASAEAMSSYADAMLPAAPYLEKDGHYTDWEGRAQRLRAVRPPKGLARSEWEIFQELSETAGADMGFRSLDDLHEEMANLYQSAALGVRGGPAERRGSGDQPTQPSGAGGTRHPEKPPAGSELILFSYPLLIDEGRLSDGADLLRDAREERPFGELHPADAERLG